MSQIFQAKIIILLALETPIGTRIGIFKKIVRLAPIKHPSLEILEKKIGSLRSHILITRSSLRPQE